MSNLPGISIVVVVLNGVDYVDGCFASLSAQDYGGPMEIIFVDGGSTDGTCEKLAALHGLRVVTCLDGIAASRNAGVAAAQYPFVAFTDVDCLVPKYWLRAFMTCYQKHKDSTPKLVGVGGGNVAVEDGMAWPAALSLMKHTFLGSNGSIYGVDFAMDKPVDHIATINALFQTEALRSQHFLRRLHHTGEDAELTWRFHKHGYLFMYCAGATIYHHMRATPLRWATRMYSYGRGRLEVMRIHPEQFAHKATLLAPMVLVFVLLLAPFLPMMRWLALLYLVTIGIQSAWAVLRARRPLLFFHVFLAFIITHLAYGLGMWRRLLTF